MTGKGEKIWTAIIIVELLILTGVLLTMPSLPLLLLRLLISLDIIIVVAALLRIHMHTRLR